MKNLILLLFLFSTTLNGQNISLSIHETSLDEYLEFEEKIGSKNIPTTSNYVSNSGNAQPIKFLRKESLVPDLIVFYYFKKADSTMSRILYEWDVRNFEKQDNNQKTADFQKALVDKYKELKKSISNEFGEPEVKSNYSNLARYDQDFFFEESSNWKPNDSTEIEMYTTVSNYYEKKGMVTINPTHRIRLYVKNTSKVKEKEVPKIDEKRLAELEMIKANFFESLKAEDLKKSKEFLSDLIIDQVTDEQINVLIANINFEKETELIYSGVQIGFDGNVFTLLQYKYATDNSNPPNELIKLVFDNKNKIVGIQPVKMTPQLDD